MIKNCSIFCKRSQVQTCPPDGRRGSPLPDGRQAGFRVGGLTISCIFLLLNLSTSSYDISKESNEFLIGHRLENFLHYYNLEPLAQTRLPDGGQAWLPWPLRGNSWHSIQLDRAKSSYKVAPGQAWTIEPMNGYNIFKISRHITFQMLPNIFDLPVQSLIICIL